MSYELMLRIKERIYIHICKCKVPEYFAAKIVRTIVVFYTIFLISSFNFTTLSKIIVARECAMHLKVISECDEISEAPWETRSRKGDRLWNSQ